MLQKCKATKFSEQGMQLFSSYLCDQIFLLVTESKPCNSRKISCGVLYSFIQGLYLFLIYVNYIPKAVKSNLLMSVIHALCTSINRLWKLKKDKELNEEFKKI